MHIPAEFFPEVKDEHEENSSIWHWQYFGSVKKLWFPPFLGLKDFSSGK
jgi:hypothetical protein